MKIPFLDLRESYLELQADIDAAVSRVLRSGCYIGGSEVEAFEHEFATYVEANYCVGVANGLEALQLALLAVGVTPGCEVVVPSHTFIATWLAVTQLGAVPVPVEVRADTHQLDESLLASAITPRCRAIVPVHLYGIPVAMDAILKIASSFCIPVVEDAAQAHGARYQGRRIGSHGAAVSWSFYPGKNLGAFGDAGAITTNDEKLATRLRLLRNYGSTVRYVHEERGFNSRLDPIQAAILRVKLTHLDAWNERRRALALRYITALSGTELVLPVAQDQVEPSWHLFPVRHPNRDTLKNTLRAQNIETLIHYPIPPHLQRAYFDLGFLKGSYPIAENIGKTVLSLPIGPAMTDEQSDRVIAAVRMFLFDENKTRTSEELMVS